MPPPGEEENFKYYGRIINSWQNVWKWRLDDFALMALDLTNNPGKNITHWYVIHLRILSGDGIRDPFFIVQHVA